MSDNEAEVLVDPPELERNMLSALVGTKVNKIELYRRAFTHKSALKRYKGLSGSYETLEFMGDSVLGFIITRHLFDKYEKEQEGFLTKARTKMVRGKTLCEIATQLGLDSWILMDDKGIRNNWNTNPNILEDVFEALVGAIYLDLGMVPQVEEPGRVVVVAAAARDDGVGLADLQRRGEHAGARLARPPPGRRELEDRHPPGPPADLPEGDGEEPAVHGVHGLEHQVAGHGVEVTAPRLAGPRSARLPSRARRGVEQSGSSSGS